MFVDLLNVWYYLHTTVCVCVCVCVGVGGWVCSVCVHACVHAWVCEDLCLFVHMYVVCLFM